MFSHVHSTGGKDDSYVNWTKPEEIRTFKEDTMDVTRDYRGKSMMVCNCVCVF